MRLKDLITESADANAVEKLGIKLPAKWKVMSTDSTQGMMTILANTEAESNGVDLSSIVIFDNKNVWSVAMTRNRGTSGQSLVDDVQPEEALRFIKKAVNKINKENAAASGNATEVDGIKLVDKHGAFEATTDARTSFINATEEDVAPLVRRYFGGNGARITQDNARFTVSNRKHEQLFTVSVWRDHSTDAPSSRFRNIDIHDNFDGDTNKQKSFLKAFAKQFLSK